MNGPSEQPETTEKKLMTAEEAEHFVRQNVYPIKPNDTRSRCVDGRYQDNGNLAPLSMPGADPGYYLVVAAALKKLNAPFSLDKKEIWDTIVASAGGENKFLFHTDSHAEHDHKGTARGCGHLRLADSDPEKYGVSKEDMNLVFTELQKLEQAHPNNYTVLEGDHKESAVFVIESLSHALKPMQTEVSEVSQGFVLHNTLNQQRLGKLADLLLNNVDVQKHLTREGLINLLHESFLTQLQATLNSLAKDLPIFQVEVASDGECKTTYVKNV